jgi:hypothetical protein
MASSDEKKGPWACIPMYQPWASRIRSMNMTSNALVPIHLYVVYGVTWSSIDWYLYIDDDQQRRGKSNGGMKRRAKQRARPVNKELQHKTRIGWGQWTTRAEGMAKGILYLGYPGGVSCHNVGDALLRRHFFARHHRWRTRDKQRMRLESGSSTPPFFREFCVAT